MSAREWLLIAITISLVGALRVKSRQLMSSAASAVSAAPRAQFDNKVLRALRVAPVFHGPPRQVPGFHFVRTRPEPLAAPLAVVAKSRAALELVQLDDLGDNALAAFLSGNELLPGSDPASHCYCGHQFGSFAGQLGDGAAMYLGEVVSEHGRWELQLKGAGPTPFSRTADGRKVLRSSIREFLGSEAMHHLGVPTTRAGSCVTSDSTVERDIFYSGQPKNEKCTVVSRIARTFVRFGSFEICRPTDPDTGRAGPSAGDACEGGALVRELVDYVCELQAELPADEAAGGEARLLADAGAAGSEARALALLELAVERTAALLAQWQSVGFTHGVLNTDNMGILGDTLDYGPYGFMGHFLKLFTPNSSDNAGRYCYDGQPRAAAWNVRKLGETLALAGLASREAVEQCVGGYEAKYEQQWLRTFRAKLGLTPRGAEAGCERAGGGGASAAERGAAADRLLLSELLDVLDLTGADMTGAFLALSSLPRLAAEGAPPDEAALEPVLHRLAQVCTGLGRAAKLARPKMPASTLRQIIQLSDAEPARLAMFGIDDDFVQFAQQQLGALDALAAVRSDADKRARDRAAWHGWLTKYAQRLASEEGGEALVAREAAMARANPAFVLREHLLQDAIARAEQGEYAGVQALLARAERPFLPAGPVDEAGWKALLADLPSDTALDIVLT